MQPQPHLQPDHAVLHGERLGTREERRNQQRRSDHDLKGEVPRRVHPHVPHLVEHVHEQHRDDEEMERRQQAHVFLGALNRFGHEILLARAEART